VPNPARLSATVADVLAGPVPVRASELTQMSRARIRAARDAGLLMSLRRGIIVPTQTWMQAGPAERHRLSVRAALLAYPGAWASHSSALILHGIDVRPASRPGAPDSVHISRTGTTFREPGLIVHGQSVPDEHVIEVDGTPASSLIRASIETGAQRSLPHAVAVMDAAMRAAIVADRTVVEGRYAVRDRALREGTATAWDAAVAPYTRHRWVTTIREAIRLADPAAESVLESLSRVEMSRAALPRPQCGVPMIGDNGVLYWLDFWWEDCAVIGEADGRRKYEADGALLGEKLRQEALLGPGRGLVRWGWPQVVPDPRPMVARLRAALTAQPPRGNAWR
jgi:hypothetical protein